MHTTKRAQRKRCARERGLRPSPRSFLCVLANCFAVWIVFKFQQQKLFQVLDHAVVIDTGWKYFNQNLNGCHAFVLFRLFFTHMHQNSKTLQKAMKFYPKDLLVKQVSKFFWSLKLLSKSSVNETLNYPKCIKKFKTYQSWPMMQNCQSTKMFIILLIMDYECSWNMLNLTPND